MKISNNISPSFGIKFINNSAYKNVKKYACERGTCDYFESAIEKLKGAGEGNVEISYGLDSKGKHFSTFTLNDMIVENTPYDGESGLEASYRGLMDLALLGGRYKTLTGTNYIKTRAGV